MRVVLRESRRRRGVARVLTLPETKGSSREHRKKDTMERDRKTKREEEREGDRVCLDEIVWDALWLWFHVDRTTRWFTDCWIIQNVSQEIILKYE